LHDAAPAGHFTLDWLMGSLHKQSFAVILLVSAIIAAAPGISIIGGFLLLILAFQMIIGGAAPVFPNWIATYPLPTKHLGALVRRTIPMLRYLERTIHPRWPTPPEATKRVIGVAVMILSIRLMIVPLPLSNIVPALVIALISLAYLEEDGLLLSIALFIGIVVLAVDTGLVWAMVHGAKWLRDLV
jgi:hypothetical protein